ncbi:hypothetical protein TYRP_007427 [Tyrophagus putrescentiae]|nr:hypothetical protein TYRP_007427 [Tyrophagus putrescentiae]
MVRAKATAGKGRKNGVSREKTAEVVDERELRTATRVVKRPRNFDNTDNLRGDYTTAAPAKKAAVQKKTASEVKTEVAASVVEALQRSYYQEVNRVEEPSSSSDVVPVSGDRSPVQLSEEQRKKLTKRQLANLLEKERNGKLIQAYEFLRNALPVIKNGSRPITKLETLTLAKSPV